MSPKDSVETSAPTVEEAISLALSELGAAEDDVEIEVLSTARSGVLGLGARQARVRVRRRPSEAARSPVASPPRAAPPPASAARAPGEEFTAEEGEAPGGPERKTFTIEEQSGQAIALLGELLALMNETAKVTLAARDPEGIELEIKGDGSGILIGRHGQTLDALEYLVNRMLARKAKDAAPVIIDTESYRARRRQQLQRMALSMGERAKRERESVVLEPMVPRDRRVIHLALKDDPLLTTRSTGQGYMRSVEVVPVERRPERGGHERRREDEPLGEQGGFKHGQKKIV